MWRQERVHTRRFMRDHHTRCPTSAGFCRILLAAPRFIVANFARRKSAIIGPGPHPACKYFHEGAEMQWHRLRPRKKSIELLRGKIRQSLRPIWFNWIMTEFYSVTIQAVPATRWKQQKMPTQKELISQTDPIVLNVVEYYFMITMSAQWTTQLLCVPRRALLFFFRNGLCKEQWQKCFGCHVKENISRVVRYVCRKHDKWNHSWLIFDEYTQWWRLFMSGDVLRVAMSTPKLKKAAGRCDVCKLTFPNGKKKSIDSIQLRYRRTDE